MKIYAEEIKDGTSVSGNTILILSKKEGQDLVELVSEVYENPKNKPTTKTINRAKRLYKDILNIPCF